MSFAVKQVARGAGGRSPSQPDKIDPAARQQTWEAAPTADGECRLIICQITDVYTLEHLASFKTMVEETKKNSKGATVVSMLTGDFLSPYLLSSVDGGNGMMNALNKVCDYLTWGNHEADIDHKTVCKHVRNFPGKWINSNMLDHEAMDHQQEYDVVELSSPDGSQKRKVGLCAVLSDDPNLYGHFSAPGAFGGATLTDPWEALKKYKNILEQDEGCDLVVPLQHLYVPDDHKTCQEFDFPVILSGHDHHRVDEVVGGTRLLKAGMNAIYATVLEISWKADSQQEPTIRARFVKNSDWEPEPVLEEENERAYDALQPLRNTELASVPARFEPLTSGNARGEVCTMGKYLCTMLKSAMNVQRRHRKHHIDAVLLMGGNIRGNIDEYPQESFLSLEALEAEIKADEVVGVVPMPGWLLAEGVEATHAGDPISGWMQYDEGVQQDASVHPPKVTHVAGQPIDPNRVYRVATKISDLTNGQSPPWTDYYKSHPELLPPKGAYTNIQSELMSYFARNIWRKLWDATTKEISDTCAIDECPDARLEVLDRSGDGIVTVTEIQHALNDLLGYSIDRREKTLAQQVVSIADTTGDGTIALEDFTAFCEEISEAMEDSQAKLEEKKEDEMAAFGNVDPKIFHQVVNSLMNSAP
jgi:2',3'-cyclic-nucleotide 2'-phosphodiesterase (5'-nucleotidase family)